MLAEGDQTGAGDGAGDGDGGVMLQRLVPSPDTAVEAEATAGEEEGEEEQRQADGTVVLQPEQPLYLRVCYYATVFGLAMFSFNVAWNFATTLLGQVGFLALSVTFITLSLSSFVSVIVITYIGSRCSMLVALVLMAQFIGFSLLKQAAVVVPSALLLGFALAIMYNTQSGYVVRCTPREKMGLVTGLFWSVVNVGPIFGNLITGELDRRGFSLTTTFLMCLCVLAVPIVMTIFLRTFDTCVICGRNQKRPTLQDLKRRVISIFSLFKNPQMLLLLPMMIAIGTAGPVLSGKITPILGPKWGGYCWTLYNVLRCVLSFPTGIMGDKLGKAVSIAISEIMLTVACVGMLFFYTGQVWLFFASFFFMGLAECTYWTATLAPAIGVYFDDVDAAFGVYRFLWPIGSSITMLVLPNLSYQAVIVLFWGVMSVALGSFFALEMYRKSYVLPYQKETPEREPAEAKKEPTPSDEESGTPETNSAERLSEVQADGEHD
eukprot:TRINITY_DN5523_c0_g1_i1.p1 TRINITY_DN5523_c0_g1~~TRINITY_DN5523_c0_g1_i1.p1  ORF type:complete len:491 (+),score=113.37 TRINITY_DN5523_c0_g1_i1:137-1609(+)